MICGRLWKAKRIDGLLVLWAIFLAQDYVRSKIRRYALKTNGIAIEAASIESRVRSLPLTFLTSAKKSGRFSVSVGQQLSQTTHNRALQTDERRTAASAYRKLALAPLAAEHQYR